MTGQPPDPWKKLDDARKAFLRALRWALLRDLVRLRRWWRRRRHWHWCPRCACPVKAGERCPNPHCDDGWLV